MKTYQTKGGVTISCASDNVSYEAGVDALINALDSHKGAVLVSNFEYPGRYTRWDMGFINPPIEIVSNAQNFKINALNERGSLLLSAIADMLHKLDSIENLNIGKQTIVGEIKKSTQHFPEELRSKQPSVFSILRAIIDLFFSKQDTYLGLYGAFGYDLAFQFEKISLQITRSDEQRDLVLYLPDEIYIIDHRKESAFVNRYDFTIHGKSTKNLSRTGEKNSYIPASSIDSKSDHVPGEYADQVQIAKESFKRGDLFEVVLSQTFSEICSASPSEIFRRLRERNPSPYSFLLNLGEAEYLVGTSPEMYVRVTGKRIETCPISGTIARGKDAIADAEQILQLLNSAKDAAELTMCTDVDRNDKSRICEPGSVRVIGRRQIEMYSRVIHTVDHVEGILRDNYDALDGFLSHTWAVTVTGAPKLWAMQFVEKHEKSPRLWYGGAVGMLGFSGDMNTGLTIRTVRIKNGIAQVRAGATLLYDSIPAEEEKETQLKASAMLDAVQRPREKISTTTTQAAKIGKNKHILLVDHQDSFVHTLANYLGQTGAKITTLRSGFSKKELEKLAPDLMVLSPGPGRPADFNVANTIAMALDLRIPIFGVCLGLQALVEYFGGELNILDYPMHGKIGKIQVFGGRLFEGLPKTFSAGLYHSLYANKAKFPSELQITAESDKGVVMAIEHSKLPIWAVQFHPESIMSLNENVGYRLIENIVKFINQSISMKE